MGNILTLVKNITDHERYLPYIPPNGRKVGAGDTVTVIGELSTILRLATTKLYNKFSEEENSGLIQVMLSMDGRIITNLGAPVGPSDAATKNYVGSNFTSVAIVLVKTANYVLQPGDAGNIISNAGAGALVVITLPAAIDLPGSGIPFLIRGQVSAGFPLRFQTVGADIISQGAGVGSAGGYIESDSPGAQIELINDEAGMWVAAPLGPTNWGLS